MEVSIWTLDARMRLPDHFFGSRQLIGVYVANTVPATFTYGISDIPLPDPVCIWQMQILVPETVADHGNYRAGLAAVIPANHAQMDAAQEIYPYYGVPHAGPILIQRIAYGWTNIAVDFRKGLVTSGKYLVVENEGILGTSRIIFSLLVSTVPKKIPAWAGAWPAS